MTEARGIHPLLIEIAAALLSGALACSGDGHDIGASGFSGDGPDDDDSPEPASDDDTSESSASTNPPGSTNPPASTNPDDASGPQPSTDPTGDPSSATASGDTSDTNAETSGGETTDGGGETTDTGGEETDTDTDHPPGASAGCGVTQFDPGTLLAVPVQVGDHERTFNIVIPDQHDGDTPLPVVLAFHGWTLNPSVMAQMSGLSATAAEHGFVVAYPQGVGNSWNAGSCCGTAFEQQMEEVAFVRALIDNIGENLCIDLDRVYATGFSNGGMLSHRLACEASDVIAAIAPVAGVIMLEDADCTPPRPMPMLHFHGTGDTSVGYYGNGMVEHVSVAESIASWVERNGCDPDPEITFMEDDTTCETWSSCDDEGVVATLCSIEGMGHCWPGDPTCIGGNGDGVASTTLPASDAIATFFSGYALP